MEAPAATVRIAGGRCEVWAAVQSPQTARDRVAKRLDLPPEKVTVNVTLLGGGFGRKSKPDFVLEAALASQAMNGQVKRAAPTRRRGRWGHPVDRRFPGAATHSRCRPQAGIFRRPLCGMLL